MGIKHSLTLPANHILTIVCDAFTMGHITRLPQPGVQDDDFTPLATNTTTVIGPYGVTRQYTLYFSRGNINFEIDPIDPATQAGEDATEAATIAYVNTQVATRATPAYVDNQVATRTTPSDVSASIASAIADRATTTYVDDEISDAVSDKATTSYVDTEIATRANRSLSNLTNPGGAIEDVATGILALPATNATAINSILAVLRTKGIIAT